MFLGLLFLQLLRLSLVSCQAKPGCRDKCGNISIPYPFGIGESCSMERLFTVTCNSTNDSMPIPYIKSGLIDITDISLITGEITVTNYLAEDCYNESGRSNSNIPSFRLAHNGPLTFSSTKNKFTALGCDTYATIKAMSEEDLTTGCISICNNNSTSMITEGSCDGFGCCQTSIPRGVRYFEVELGSYSNHSNVLQFNPCSYAFLVDQNWFRFGGISDLSGYMERNNGSVPVVLDWAIGNKTCQEAKVEPDYACLSQNSYCYDSTNGPGYRCNCTAGYQGNPYLQDIGGCEDIDECRTQPCKGICINTRGGYKCDCPKGKHSVDPNKYECKSPFPVVKVTLGIGIPFILALFVSWIYLGLQRRKFINFREKFYKENGGLHLQNLISSYPNITFKLFSEEDLKSATNKFDRNNILGQGGQGMVYKGILPNNQVVAVKKSIVVNAMQGQQFANEMLILSQINHKNVVKLLGCCLEVEIPILVYEFISNGNLFHFIHGECQLSLKTRLTIAAEAAYAIAYLHSAASPPIIHGDVKSSNILLDENYTAKVSDFGASKLTPTDKDQFATFMQGTLGYLDPECLQTGILTEKSDVYSFGVVLVELLSRRKAVSQDGSEQERNLAHLFMTSMNDNRLMDVLDHEIMNEGKMDLIHEVSRLAKRCLSVQGKERPTMKEVATELEGLAVLENHPWMPNNPETESLLNKTSDTYVGESSEFFSLEKRAVLSIEPGR
ncbi:Wall-associated receptor kinase 2 [Acorus gramineus]|uniref:Wall-associated receptor kinase 2 n=1 Tax=Acorus gramineus TaxID=55184 RepID=A0AAV9ALV4_ACOGR|nr:Wall-associated receptor kinase 2 [Acorus gramineus]